MFTGLIQALGTVERVTPGAVTDLWVKASFSDGPYVLGESIACNGVCLTVVEFSTSGFKVQAAPETLRRTSLGRWQPGDTINLERALKAGERLGGHLVQGHVDFVTQVTQTRADGGSWAVTCALPREWVPFFVEKGSVCIDGISLTLTAATADSFSVMLIPETMQRTSLGRRSPGDPVNIEVDIIGKYVARMMGQRSGLTEAQLRQAGFGH